MASRMVGWWNEGNGTILCVYVLRDGDWMEVISGWVAMFYGWGRKGDNDTQVRANTLLAHRLFFVLA